MRNIMRGCWPLYATFSLSTSCNYLISHPNNQRHLLTCHYCQNTYNDAEKIRSGDSRTALLLVDVLLLIRIRKGEQRHLPCLFGEKLENDTLLDCGGGGQQQKIIYRYGERALCV